MGQRNMSYSNHITDLGADQHGEEHMHPEPCVLFGSFTAFAHPNVHTMVPAPGNAANFYLHHLPNHEEGTLIYGMSPYNGVQHQQPATTVDLAIATSSNHYNPYMAAPSSSTDFPVPINQGLHDRLPFSGTHGILGINADSYGRNNPYVDGVGGSFKRKNAEGIHGNFQCHPVLAGSSSSVVPVITRAHESDVSLMDVVSFPPEYGRNDSSSFIEDGAQRSVRNRSGASGQDTVLRNNNHLHQGNYVGQAYQLPGNPWLDLPFNSNGSEAETWAWNQAAPLTYPPGGIGGCVDAGNMGGGYPVTASNGGVPSFLHPPIPQGHPNHYHLAPNMQSVRGHSMTIPPQMTASPRRHLPNSSTNNTNNPFQVVGAGSRYSGAPPTGIRLYRPHRREFVLETNTRHRNLPNMRVLPEDGVAMLDVPGYHEVGDTADQHRDLRLDIDHMSYEELLALGEQIGNVRTGLPEEVVVSHLKRRLYLSSKTPCPSGSAMCLDHETDFCVICQTDYNDQESIGILECGHEYHEECVKKWLVVKNTCPICKSTALLTKGKDL